MISVDVKCFKSNDGWEGLIAGQGGTLGPYETFQELVERLVNTTYSTNYDEPLYVYLHVEDQSPVIIVKPVVL